MPIQVVGIGLGGAASLSAEVLAQVQQADLLVGSPRHLSYFPDQAGEVWVIRNFRQLAADLQARLHEVPTSRIVVLASGDPLFFGIGRVLLAALPPDQLVFHPHVSSIQLAFSRLKLPWQNATLISAHGRSAEALIQAVRRGDELIAVLTDSTYTPAAIGRLVRDLNLPQAYRLWVCENLGSDEERIGEYAPDQTPETFAALNVVVLQRLQPDTSLWEAAVPQLGIPDSAFLSFEDRPGLMTKREVRLQILGEMALCPGQVVWDIGAGTGSVSIEMARLCPTAQIFAIEKTAMGFTLIQQNCQRFGITNVTAVHGTAPAATKHLPAPDRIFIGGSGGYLAEVLTLCLPQLRPGGQAVVALATLENQSEVLQWLQRQQTEGVPWRCQWLQIQVSRSAVVGPLTRWLPQNPVILATLNRQPKL